MTNTLYKRVGKLLFPHLPRDQRKHLLTTIILVLMFSLALAGIIAAVILNNSRH